MIVGTVTSWNRAGIIGNHKGKTGEYVRKTRDPQIFRTQQHDLRILRKQTNQHRRRQIHKNDRRSRKRQTNRIVNANDLAQAGDIADAPVLNRMHSRTAEYTKKYDTEDKIDLFAAPTAASAFSPTLPTIMVSARFSVTAITC